MSDHEPIFIDQFGTGGGSDPDKGPNLQFDEGPFWKLGWQGKLELWKAFWVYFVFGHGIVIGIGGGIMVFGLLAGFAADPASISSGASGLAVAAIVVGAAFLVFAVWAVVSVWRCADNCTVKTRGVWARVVIVGYVTALLLPVIDFAMNRGAST